MKTCIVCGYVVGDNVKECPNCGSYDFRRIELEETNIKLRRFK